MSSKLGSALCIGDVIAVWWTPGHDIITNLRPYSGPLAPIFPHGAQLADFALNKSGMTIENNILYEVIEKAIED
jgi:hypothetical protein